MAGEAGLGKREGGLSQKFREPTGGLRLRSMRLVRGIVCHVGKVQASVARCLRTPPYAAKRKDLKIDYSNRLRGQSNRSTIVVGNYA